MQPTLTDYFLRGRAQSPNGVALRIGRQEWTYDEVHATALAWAGPLRTEAEATGSSRIGLLADRSAVSYIGLLAIMYAGCAPVPLNASFPVERNVSILEQAGAVFVLADNTAMLHAEEYRVLGVPLHDPQILGSRSPRPPRLSDPLAPPQEAYVLFTSGSTGRPKGVPITQGNMHHFLETIHKRFDFSASDAFTQTFDPTFDLAMFDIFVAWSVGATLVMTPSLVFANLPKFIANNEISVWFSVPSSIRVAQKLGALQPGAFPSLRWSLFCGEALPIRDAHAWKRAAAGSTVVNLYGPTELTIACSAYDLDAEVREDASNGGVVPIGPLFDGLDGVLLDESGAANPIEGELCVRGPQMFGGYIDPADDNGRFVEHGGHTWYRTGDRIRRDGQQVLFVGRMDQQVKIRGYRIELGEIDYAARSIQGVREVATVAVGSGELRELAICYSGNATEHEVVDILRQRLPDYMVPTIVRTMTALPTNQNGKIDRKALARGIHDGGS